MFTHVNRVQEVPIDPNGALREKRIVLLSLLGRKKTVSTLSSCRDRSDEFDAPIIHDVVDDKLVVRFIVVQDCK
jgi:hypothetical protein